jgi:hypothetical protein
VAVNKETIVAQKNAGELSDGGKRQYKLFALKTKVHTGFSDFGARVYTLMGTRTKNPSLDAKARNIVSRLKKIETQIGTLESEKRQPLEKTPSNDKSTALCITDHTYFTFRAPRASTRGPGIPALFMSMDGRSLHC